MLVALFGPSKKTTLQRVQHSEWKDPKERDELLALLLAERLKPADFVFLLSHSDPACRQAGATFVQRHTGPGLLEALIDAAEGKPELVRKAIMRFAAAVPPAEAVASIERLIAPSSPPPRQRLGWQLAMGLPKQARAPFVERGIQSDNAALRAQAVQFYLEDLTPGAAPPPLLLSLARDPEERVRTQVVGLLESTQSAAVVDLMIDRLLHDGPGIRQRALAYLSRVAAKEGMQDRILAMLSDGDDDARRAAVELLLKVYSPADALVRILEHSRSLLGWLRARILETLKGFGEVMLQPIAKLLEHPSEDIRTQALVLTESIRDRRFVPAISKLLADPDWWIRITAADCLGAIGDESAVPALVGALRDPECQWAALDALAKIKSPRALRPITEMLRDDKPELRLEAVTALGQLGDPNSLKVLEQVAATDPAQAVRSRAAEVAAALAKKLHLPSSGIIDTSSRRTEALSPLDQVLAAARQQKASDVHITIGEPPCFRIGGEMKRASAYPVVTEETARSWLKGILPPLRAKQLEERGEVDLCHVIPEVGRHRANIFEQRNGLCGAFRIIPNLPPTLMELRIPSHLTELMDFHQGIIAVTGPAGSGKSTTLAALVNLINETKPHHVISLEDPIEFVHPVKSALINQREVGRHTESFERALRAALREDPDVIVVGEMRDPETMRMALTAAETGHLVLATLHTTSAVQTIERLVEAFPPEEQSQVRMALSESLKYVICQSLLPRTDGNGRVAVFEVLKSTLSVANLIRENKTYQIPSLMQIGQGIGMRTVDMALQELLDAGLISPEAAYARAEKKESFEAVLPNPPPASPEAVT